jgi:hypothetical protein
MRDATLRGWRSRQARLRLEALEDRRLLSATPLPVDVKPPVDAGLVTVVGDPAPEGPADTGAPGDDKPADPAATAAADPGTADPTVTVVDAPDPGAENLVCTCYVLPDNPGDAGTTQVDSSAAADPAPSDAGDGTVPPNVFFPLNTSDQGAGDAAGTPADNGDQTPPAGDPGDVMTTQLDLSATADPAPSDAGDGTVHPNIFFHLNPGAQAAGDTDTGTPADNGDQILPAGDTGDAVTTTLDASAAADSGLADGGDGTVHPDIFFPLNTGDQGIGDAATGTLADNGDQMQPAGDLAYLPVPGADVGDGPVHILYFSMAPQTQADTSSTSDESAAVVASPAPAAAAAPEAARVQAPSVTDNRPLAIALGNSEKPAVAAESQKLAQPETTAPPAESAPSAAKPVSEATVELPPAHVAHVAQAGDFTDGLVVTVDQRF